MHANRELMTGLRAHAKNLRQLSFPPATDAQLLQTESELSFPIPGFLRECYSSIANGGFGWDWGIIGVEGGQQCDTGTLAPTYRSFQIAAQKMKRNWPYGLLPIQDCGCALWICVSIEESVFLCDEMRLEDLDLTVQDMFELWIDGEDILD